MLESISYNTCPKYAEKNERQQLDYEPFIVVLDVEQYKMVIAEWIKRTQNKCCRESAEERPPQSLHWKIIAHLLQTIIV